LTHYAVYRGRYNGVNEWALLDSNITANSFTDTGLSPLTEYHYRVVGYNADGAATQTAEIFGASGAMIPVPSPWISQDIGSVGAAGVAGYSNGTFTIIGGGADIWGTSDAFHYVYAPMTGDGYIVARVAAMKDPAANYYSRGGLMIRESTAVGSKQVSLMLHTTDAGVRLQSRSSTNSSTSEILGPADTRAPYWLLLSRSGTTITGKISTDGSTWTTVGSVDVSMGTSVLIGMALTPRDNAYMHWASFDHVSSTVTGTDAAGLDSEASAELTSTNSLPNLPESVFASGTVGAFGASSIWQTLAATACQCCAFDCGITPLGTSWTVHSESGGLSAADQIAASTHLHVGEQFGNSLPAFVNAPVASITWRATLNSNESIFGSAHRRAVDDAFATLRNGQTRYQSAGLLEVVCSSLSRQTVSDDDASSEIGPPTATTRNKDQTAAQDEMSGPNLGCEIGDPAAGETLGFNRCLG
jgi:hypothetical protein